MTAARAPNILLIMTDEERFPPHYEGAEIAAYRDKQMPGRRKIREAGVSFQRHYAASTACEPSRASLFTGQYPSLHGVRQTSGLAKSSFGPGLFRLPPNTVPTIGNWFQADGRYHTYYNGKWHISDQDLIIPGSHNALMTNDREGKLFPERVALYREANRLSDYGFDGWIGPEPHGSLAANSGTVRDPGFARQTMAMLDELENEAQRNPDYAPWLAVCSFVNPHDIVFSGESWKLIGLPEPDLAGIPLIDPPTRHEDLACKPRCQKDYVLDYSLLHYRQPTLDRYYQLYLYLQARVDKQIDAVYSHLAKCPQLFRNTVVIFTSDHGDALGAHGGMHQKWYNAYDECLRVPLYISTPAHRSGQRTPRTDDTLTSHVDLLPTLLELAGIDVARAASHLVRSHSEVHKPVGRSLASHLDGRPAADSPVYFMTDDEVDEELHEISAPKFTEQFLTQSTASSGKEWLEQLEEVMAQRAARQPLRPVIEPHHIETVIARVDGALYKLSRYFEKPRLIEEEVDHPLRTAAYNVPDEWELYQLDADPDEADNLLSPCSRQTLPAGLIEHLRALLAQQRQQKRLRPATRNPGVPA